MRVLVVGSGGREHALVWKIAQSPLAEAVFAAPGSAGMSAQAQCFPDVAADDFGALQDLVERESVDLVVVGPEDPLAAGLADLLRESGVAVFGPSAAAAQLEASKSFAKNFMQRHHIPTADHRVFEVLADARAYVSERPGPCVVKADGLAAGKGVAICMNGEEACAALDEMMTERRFGDAGSRVVIEEFLEGEEASFYAITDGQRVVTLAAAQDHKRALDGDVGENTGGMGAYSPAPIFNEEVEKRVLDEVVHPAIRGMAAEGTPYQGVLFVGLMIDAEGNPRVVEFNVRFGDPETQPLMVRMKGDLLPLLDGAARGHLDEGQALEWGDAAVCVVLASGGYPRAYETGVKIQGIEAAESGAVVFHAGTKKLGDVYVTAGGRVLGVTARGASVAEARDRAYTAAKKISFERVHLRSDIALRGIEQ